MQGVTVTPTNGASIVAAISLQFWSEHHSFVFAVIVMVFSCILFHFHVCKSKIDDELAKEIHKHIQ